MELHPSKTSQGYDGAPFIFLQSYIPATADDMGRLWLFTPSASQAPSCLRNTATTRTYAIHHPCTTFSNNDKAHLHDDLESNR
mmetsp:Transcript_12692/g.26317  ORF Transcript_12692/g.26317 Transcript_12692/m.26317 type:complete len:83 (+) Transcript_12692:11-259(+)